MCLEKVLRKEPPKTGKFWKYFCTNTPGILLGILDHPGGFRRGVWLKAFVPFRVEFLPYPYRIGFHGYPRKPRKSPWVRPTILIQCRYRGGHTIGKQHGLTVIVADEIFIPLPRKTKSAKSVKSADSGPSHGGNHVP